MKIRLSFKTPDVIDYAVEDLNEDDREEAVAVCKKWIKYGECMTVEIDTETGECTPIPV